MSSKQAARPPPSCLLGKSPKTVEGYQTGLTYTNKYLELYDYPPFDELSFEAVENEFLQELLGSIGTYVAGTNFVKRGGGYVAESAKLTYFKAIKEIFKHKFPTHSAWNDKQWWTDMRKDFETHAKRHHIEDTDITVIRKSEPLYRDLDDDATALRAKYSNATQIDCKMIARSMISSNFKSGGYISVSVAGQLLEFNTCRTAAARGGEHSFTRWSEAAYDLYYDAPDFDWAIIKQSERQCMLLFCDRFEYSLCPIFSFGVYFMYGGIRRDGISDALKTYVFPHLHNKRRDKVAAGLTSHIRAQIPLPNDKPRFSSRSLRNAVMTENRMHPDLSMQEEYARSGHTHAPGENKNAEGYIQSTPALNAPGGMALAGYTNCHVRATAYSFVCLGEADKVVDAVQRLIQELYKNDIPQLQLGRPLYNLIITSAARLVGSFNQLFLEQGADNDIVVKIMEAARRARIEDSLPNNNDDTHASHAWLAVTKDWSRKITTAFNTANPLVPPEDAELKQQIVGIGGAVEKYGQQMMAVAARNDSHEEDKATAEVLRDANRVKDQEIAKLRSELNAANIENARLKRENTRFKNQAMNMLNAAPSPSPKRGRDNEPSVQPQQKRRVDTAGPAIAVDAAAPAPASSAAQVPAPVEAAAAAPAVPAPVEEAPKVAPIFRLDGIPKTNEKTSGVNVSIELQRIWDHMSNKKAAPDNNDEETLQSKAILYKSNQLMAGVHPAFVGNETSRYTNAMKLVAMSVGDDEWKKFISFDLVDREMRDLFASVQKATLVTILEMEVQAGTREAGTKSKAQAGLHSLGERFRKACAAWGKLGMSDIGIEQYVNRKVFGEERGQSTLGSYFQNQNA